MKTINLGYTNGWGIEDNVLFKDLQKNKIENSGSCVNIGRCLNEYSFETIQDNEVVKITYKVDSGG
jgi:hypothetical protein